MTISQEITALLTGFGIGFIASLIGGIMSYIVYLRDNPQRAKGALGYVFIVTGLLFAIGVVAIALSLVVNEFAMAVLTGAGVFIGFSLAFALLIWVAIRTNRLDDSTT